jgi:hypothetical protein
MNLPVAPFFRRALQVDSRAGRTYLLRVGVLVVMLVALAAAHSLQSYLGAPGLRLFSTMVYTNAFLICLAGPGLFASAITDEKENMSLGLVRMTGLRPLWILLGTVAAQLLSAVMLVLVQVPFTVLAVTLGGVAVRQVLAGYLSLTALLLLVACLSVLASTVCRRNAASARLAVLLLIGFFIVPIIGSESIKQSVRDGVLARNGFIAVRVGGLLQRMRDAAAFTRLEAVMATGFAGPVVGYQVWSNLALAGLCFLLSWAAFERFAKEESAPGPARIFELPRPSSLRPLRVGRAWNSALVWKDFYFTAGGKGGLLLKTVLVGAAVVAIAAVAARSGASMSRQDVGGMMMAIALGVGFIDLSLQLSRVFGQERRWRTLSGIMILPMSTRRIAYSKLLGCLLGLTPYLLWLVIGAATAPEMVADSIRGVPREPSIWFFLCSVLFFFNLVAYLSLVLRRGGLLLAFGLWYICTMVVGALVAMLPLFLFRRGSGVAFLGMAAVFVLLAALLHDRTLRRLAKAAAE